MKKIYTLAAAASLIAATAVGQQPIKNNATRANTLSKENINLLNVNNTFKKTTNNLKAGNDLTVFFETSVDPADWTLSQLGPNTEIEWVIDTLNQVDPTAAGNSTIEAYYPGVSTWDDQAQGNALVAETINKTAFSGAAFDDFTIEAALTAPITVTAGSDLAVQWRQLYRPYNQDVTRLKVKQNAGDPWTIIAIAQNDEAAFSTGAPQQIVQTISSFTSTMTTTTLYIAFEFEATYNAGIPVSQNGAIGWAIDDIKITEEATVDIVASTIYQSDIINGDQFADDYYGAVPLHSLGDSLAFTVVVKNNGKNTENVDVLVELVDGSSVVDASGTTTVSIAPGDFTAGVEAVEAGVWVLVKMKTPKEQKNYTVRATVSSANTDDLPDNNVSTESYSITQNIYQPYDNNQNSISVSAFDDPVAANSQGVLFGYPTAGTEITGMRIYIANATASPLPTDVAQFNVNVYYVPATADLSDGVSTVVTDGEAINLTPSSPEIFVDSEFYDGFYTVDFVDVLGAAITVLPSQTTGKFLLTYTSPSGQAYGAYVTDNNLDGKGLWIGLNGSGTSFISAYRNTTPIMTANSKLATGIADKAVEANFSLGQNVPNPFNGTTSISYNLVDAASVSLAVYDLTGKKVFTTGTNVENAGEHTVTIDAANFNAGLYYYTLNVDGQALTKKMIVTK